MKVNINSVKAEFKKSTVYVENVEVQFNVNELKNMMKYADGMDGYDRLTLKFTPTGLGDTIQIKKSDSKKSKYCNITDYDAF